MRLLRPCLRAPFEREIGLPPPVLSDGEKLDVVDQVDAALSAFGRSVYRGVTRP